MKLLSFCENENKSKSITYSWSGGSQYRWSIYLPIMIGKQKQNVEGAISLPPPPPLQKQTNKKIDKKSKDRKVHSYNIAYLKCGKGQISLQAGLKKVQLFN